MTGTILFVIADLEVGGTEHHLVRILPALLKAGFRPVVFTLTDKHGLASHIESAGIPVMTPPLAGAVRRLPRSARRVLLLPGSVLRLWRLMRRTQPAVVHFFLPRAYLVGGLAALLARHRPLVMSRRSLNDYQRRHPILARFERWLHPRMAAILANSQAVMRQLAEEGAPGDRLGLIYSGIDAEAFDDLPPRAELRAGLGIGEATLALVTVANLIPYKGHADLLDALSGIGPRLPAGWVLLCAGRDDGIGEALRARARALGIDAHVRWLGERRDIPALLGASDVGILASHEEGFSLTILEGMAVSLPMVVTAVGGNPEAVLHEVSGLVIPARDPAALGAAILALARDPALRQRLGDAGRTRVRTVFSLEACVSRYRRLYTLLAAGQTTPIGEALAAEPRR